MGRLSRPLNSDAVKAADDEFYAKHPELVKEGKRIPLSATDPSQADLRKEWVELYKKHGGKEEEDASKPPAKKPADPVQPCPLQKSISGQFKETEAKCGDPGHVEADGVQISEGANTTFSIYRIRDNKALKSVSGPMNGKKSGIWHGNRSGPTITRKTINTCLMSAPTDRKPRAPISSAFSNIRITAPKPRPLPVAVDVLAGRANSISSIQMMRS